MPFTVSDGTALLTKLALRQFVLAFLLLLGLEGLVASSALAQFRQIEIEIWVDQRAPTGTAQQWAEIMNSAGANRVTVKVGKLDRPTIEQFTLANSEIIKAQGKVEGTRLLLPAESFSAGDRYKIKAWVERIRDDGVEVGLGEKQAFGLTAPQLVDLHQTLSVPVRFKTQGASASQSLNKIAQQLDTQFVFDQAASQALSGSETILEELEGFSVGTAIAIIVRPLGLVFQPQRQQGQPLKLMLVDSQSSGEHWPIGWPIEVMPVRAAPKLFERLDLEIRSFPLKGTLDAIEKRTGISFIYDQNSMARQGIEIEETKVTFVKQKATYSSAINNMLGQTKPRLKYEIRMDEAGKTFLWISP